MSFAPATTNARMVLVRIRTSHKLLKQCVVQAIQFASSVTILFHGALITPTFAALSHSDRRAPLIVSARAIYATMGSAKQSDYQLEVRVRQGMRARPPYVLTRISQNRPKPFAVPVPRSYKALTFPGRLVVQPCVATLSLLVFLAGKRITMHFA